MTPLQFLLANPLATLVVAIGFLIFLFLPVVAIALVILFWLYSSFIHPLFISSKIEQKSYTYTKPADIPKPQSVDILPYETGNHFKIDPTLTGQFMSAEDKSAYLQSPKWQALRQQVIARDKCCVVTGRTSNLDVHHVTYKRLGNELLEDLVLIHRDVHNAIHQKLGYDRTTYFPISAYKD